MPRASKSNYEGMDWVDALSKRNQPPADIEKSLAEATASAQTPQEEIAAAERSSNIVFDVPVDPLPQKRAIEEASRKAMDAASSRREAENVVGLKKKLADHGVDPVSLGVVSRAEWNAIADISKAEALAKEAALRAEAALAGSWEDRAIAEMKEGPRRIGGYDPELASTSQVMSTAWAHDDIVPHNPAAPMNAASMSDPDRLARLASEGNEHDAGVQAARDRAKEREEITGDWRTEEVPEDVIPMKGASVIPAGGHDADVSRYRAPADQVSMTDDLSGKLSELFSSRIPDARGETRAANEARRASIQRPPEEDERAWDNIENQKPKSTSEMQRKLADLWMPDPEGK
jgi:hypothetical protein